MLATVTVTNKKLKHAKRKRILADRYANSNILKSASMEGIQERSAKFVRRCASSSGAADVFVSVLGLHPSVAELTFS